jgi:ribosomal protein S18 acetylase RimI-like enzyme
MELDTTIRPADRGDSRFIAWVMQEAARSHLDSGIMDFVLPDARQRLDFLDAVQRTKTRSFFHGSRFLIAELDGRAAAGLSGYEGTGPFDLYPTAFEEAWQELGWPTAELEAMEERLHSIEGAFPDVPEDRWVVEFVATLPEFRGHGIVSQLMHEILQIGRGEDFARAQIGCFIGNTRARRVYERAGFRIVDEKRDPDWEIAIGCPGMWRMHMDL